MLATNKQVLNLISQSKNIVILFPQKYNADHLAAALALEKITTKNGAITQIISNNFTFNSRLDFLSQDKIKDNLNNTQKLVIEVDLADKGLDDISYEKDGNIVRFFLTSQRSNLDSKQVRSHLSNYNYDLIITLGINRLDQLGSLYDNQKDFFHSIPIINIDYLVTNENFGQLNLVQINKSSYCEIILDFINETEIISLDASLAQYLLTGIISSTKNFKISTTQYTLQKVGQLLSAGAKREAITEKLYRQQSINSMKLWGRLLNRMRSDYQGKIAWSLINSQDLLETGTKFEELSDLIDEFSLSLDGLQILLLFIQTQKADNQPEEVIVRIYSFGFINSAQLTDNHLISSSHQLSELKITGKNILQVEKEVMEKVRKNFEQTFLRK